MNETRKEWLARIKRPLARLQNSRTEWYRIQNKADETPKLYIYDEIGYFGDSAKALVDQLRDVKGDELEVHLNSPGGDIFDGLAIYQALKDHPAKVTVHVDGLAASIASVIAQAGDRIVMAPKASMMIHDGWTMAVGNAADMRKTADLLDKQSQIIASVYADRTGFTADFWRERMSSDTWYDANEALEAGLVDEVEGQAVKTIEEPFDLSVYAHSSRESAPAPVLKPVAIKGEPGPETIEPPAPEPPVVEPEPQFTWDFASFKSALKEGMNG